MKEERICLECGKKYHFTNNTKHGATTRKCSACAKKSSNLKTKRMMLDAAGGGCRRCGYSRNPYAIEFIDIVERISKPIYPKNREQKIAYAQERVAICNRCNLELKYGFLFMHIRNARLRPPDVFFYTEEASQEFIQKKKEPNDVTEVEIVDHEPKELRQAKGTHHSI